MKEFKINEQLLTEIINYLANRPWKEVNRLIGQITQVEEIKKEECKKSKNS